MVVTTKKVFLKVNTNYKNKIMKIIFVETVRVTLIITSILSELN